jgi:alpha-galactosidase
MWFPIAHSRAAEIVQPAAMQRKGQWAKEHLLSAPTRLPFSFVYGKQPSAQLLSTWLKKTTEQQLDPNRVQHTVTWTDPKTGLEVKCVAVEYTDYPVLEWTLWFKNTRTTNTPILENILAVDSVFPGAANGACRLHYIDGDGRFAPHEKTLVAGKAMRFAPLNGRPTDGCFPYYNLDWTGRGVILVVGWPGQWASSFACDSQGNLRAWAGQELTHFTLHPGEEARSPRITLLFWEGDDWLRAQNVWRHWMRKHNMPRPDGQDVPVLGAGGGFMYEKLGWGSDILNEKDQNALIDAYQQQGLKLNCWWIDITGAGTFERYSDKYIQNELYGVSWETDHKRFPHGMRAVSDHARAKGEKFLVWFEPEHVNANNVLFQHKDWLLSAPDDPNVKRQINQGLPLGERRVVNLGHPAAWQWTLDLFARLIGDEGIDVYRQDFNIEPLLFWRHADAADRWGMTENLCVQGYLRFWDALRARYPRLLIDSCASGGRRNDLETMRRAVPLWRSDNWGPDVVLQNQTYGLALWIPYFGTGVNATKSYPFRSALGSSLFTSWDVRDRSLNFDTLRRLNREFWRTAPFFVEDYYPLSAFSPAADAWMAWQFNRPDQGDGLVQAFRRDKCAEPAKTFRLHGLDPAAQYEVTNFDVEGATKSSGKTLMEQGLAVEIKDQPGAAVLIYRRAR